LHWPGSSGASVATTAITEPEPGGAPKCSAIGSSSDTGWPAGVAACGSAWLGVFTVTNLHIDYAKSFTVIVSL
jgi:hypothetical protein